MKIPRDSFLLEDIGVRRVVSGDIGHRRSRGSDGSLSWSDAEECLPDMGAFCRMRPVFCKLPMFNRS